MAPIAALVVQAMVTMIQMRFTAAAAAQEVAAQYEYFRKVSEAELTEVALEMGKRYPEYNYWQWFNMLKSLQSYRMLPSTTLPPATVPINIPTDGGKEAAIAGNNWILYAAAGLVVLAAIILWR